MPVCGLGYRAEGPTEDFEVSTTRRELSRMFRESARVFLWPYRAAAIGSTVTRRLSRGQCWVGSTMSMVLPLGKVRNQLLRSTGHRPDP